MGTNFYRRSLITIEKKEEAKKLIDSNNFDECIDLLNANRKEVHICKRSGGWKVCFDHNWGKHYDLNRNSIDIFLNEENTEIVDEYGETYTPEQFWKMVDEWNSNPRNSWVSKTYEEYEKSKDPNFTTYNDYFDRDKCKDVFDIKCDSDDFESDGLRFAVYSEFS